MAKVTTSHYAIFDYWKNKIIGEDGNVTTDKSDKGIYVIVDWGEPCCWACGKPFVSEYEKTYNLILNDKKLTTGKVDFKKVWNDEYIKSNLNRCHIIPGSLGGEDKPENLFLMCEDCHEKSPDTIKARTFLRWVYDMRKTHMFGIDSPQVMFEKLKEGLSRRGLEPILADLGKITLSSKEIKDSLCEYMSKCTCTHWSKYSEQTRIEGFVDWLIHIYTDACLESAEQHGIID